MSTTVEVVYRSALLADASYVSFQLDEFVDTEGQIAGAAWDQKFSNIDDVVTFQDRGFTFEQFQQFQADYHVIHHQPDTATGFSATLFQETATQALYLGFRGTNDLADWVHDAVLALEQANVIGNLLNAGVVDDFLQSAGILDAGGGVLPEYAGRVHLVGHSLGGHLALWTANTYPGLVASVDTFNGAGLDYGNPVRLMLEALWDDTVAPSFGGGGLDAAVVRNFYAEPGQELTATGLFAYRPGMHVPVFIEDQSATAGAFANHSMAHLVDSLAVYRVFGMLDPALDFEDIRSILGAASNEGIGSLQAALRALGESLGGDYADLASPLELAERLRRDIDAGLWSDVRIVPLAGEDLLAGTLADSATGNAYRFAAVNLLPFALESAAGTGAEYVLAEFSVDYLAQRAYLLESLLLRNRADAITTAELGRGPEYFSDLASGLEFTSSQAAAPYPLDAAAQYRFGTDQDDLVAGGEQRDALFGGGGHDALDAGSGGDYLDGGAGDDELRGGGGADTLTGGDGNDVLRGGAGDDLLSGGGGADRFYYESGGGVDVVLDYDDGGDRVFVDGVDLASLEFVESPPGSGSYRAGGSGLVLRRDTAFLSIFSEDAPGAGAVVLVNYSEVPGHDFGIVLQAGGVPAVEERVEPPAALVIVGDREPLDANPDQDGVQLEYDALGNVIVDTASVALRDDTLFGADGNDAIDAGDGDNRVLARAGDDTVRSGSGADVLRGEDGADILRSGAGADSLSGGAGADWLEGGAGTDILAGGDGDDVLFAGAASDIEQIEDPAAAPGLERDWLAGGPGADTLVGSAGADGLSGGAGSDLIYGGAGDDQIMGDADLLATDVAWSFVDDPATLSRVFMPVDGVLEPAGAAADTLFGGAGDDWISAGAGNDTLYGNSGSDQLGGYAGNDSLHGGDGADRLIGDGLVMHLDPSRHGDDYLSGAAGDDELIGGGGNDVLLGGDGNDLLRGDAEDVDVAFHGADRLVGGRGDDTLTGDGGADHLDGGEGADVLNGDGGSDRLYGGSGDDRLWGDSSTLVPEDDGADVLYGGSGNDQLIGGGGDDLLDGGTDADTLWGGDGADRLDGGGGDDELYGGAEGDELFGGDGADQLFGEAGDDRLHGGYGNDILQGDGGDDTVWGESGDDVVTGQDGNDHLIGGSGDDELGGGAGRDRLLGGAGRDFIYGDDDDDWLDGGAGVDSLYGDAGNDTLAGGPGDDWLYGGDGDDTYVFRVGGGSDTLSDAAGETRLVFEGIGDAGALQVSHTAGGANVSLDFAGGSVSLPVGEYKRLASLSTGGVAFTGADMMRPTEAADRVLLPGTSDTLHTLAGDDIVYGGAGDDALHGDANDDLLHGEDGGDLLEGGTGADELHGDAGDDWLLGGEGADSLSGGAGDDRLTGGAGDDLLDGGSGNDRYRFDPGFGRDTILRATSAAGEVDTVEFGAGILPEDLRLRSYASSDLYLERGDGASDVLIVAGYFDDESTSPVSRFVFEADPSVVWTRSDIDARFGPDAATELDDRIEGFAGDDVIYALAGNDVVWGGAGHDTLIGGSGLDALYGQAGDDWLDGGAEDDTLEGGAGRDRLLGGSGADRLDGADGDDVLEGGDGDDELRGGIGADTYVYAPGDGRDLIVETDGKRAGESYHDTLSFSGGLSPADIEVAPVLRDFLGDIWYANFYESAIDIAIRLPASNGEVLISGEVSDASNYYSRIDEFRFSDVQRSVLSWNDVYTDLVTLDDGHDLALGTASADVLEGQAGDDILFGAGGSDILRGGADSDTLIGAGGADTLDGGPGNDFLRGGDDPSPNDGLVDLYVWGSGYGHDTAFARPDDYYWYYASTREPYPADELELSGVAWEGLWAERNGDDLGLYIPGTADRLTVVDYFVGGHFQLRIRKPSSGHYGQEDVELKIAETEIQRQVTAGDDHVIGSEERGDTIAAGAGNDILEGRAGADWLDGGEGDDLLLGQTGDDRLIGGSGSDTLAGGEGNDALAGGEGNDTYRFGVGDGADWITDQDKSSGRWDAIVFDAPVAPDDVRIARSGDDLVLSLVETGDEIGVTQHFVAKGRNSGHHVDEIRFADGSAWSRTDLLEFVGLSVSGDYVLQGGAGADTLVSLGGDDVLHGNGGDDVLRAGAGADLLVGGVGADVLDGGKGADRYLFERGDGSDLIVERDTGAAVDAIEFGLGLSPAQVSRERLDGNDLLLDFGGGDSIRIEEFFLSGVAVGPGIEELHFADGTVWGRQEMAQGPANRAPIAEPDTVFATRDEILPIGFDALLGNDSDPDGDPLDIVAAGAALNGSVEFDPSTRQIRFTPLGGFEGEAAFTYTVSDGALDASASVAVAVLAPNTVPLAITDEAATVQGAAIVINERELLGNDHDPDGDVLAVSGVAAGFGGSVSWDEANRIVSFEPEGYFFGQAWFGYMLSDGRSTAEGRVEVAVTIDASGNALLGTGAADSLVGGRGDERLYGLGGDDLLSAGRGQDVLWGGPGVDMLDGGWGDDVYVFQRGDGTALIDNRSSKASDHDVLQFTSGVTPQDLWFAREADNLLVEVIGADERVVIDGWYGSDAARLDEIRTPGATLLASQVDQLVQAMAGFAAPMGAGLSLPEDTRQQLEPVIAAAWQPTA